MMDWGLPIAEERRGNKNTWSAIVSWRSISDLNGWSLQACAGSCFLLHDGRGPGISGKLEKAPTSQHGRFGGGRFGLGERAIESGVCSH
jgi:hypothetical protein